jgi:hypothetical protein
MVVLTMQMKTPRVERSNDTATVIQPLISTMGLKFRSPDSSAQFSSTASLRRAGTGHSVMVGIAPAPPARSIHSFSHSLVNTDVLGTYCETGAGLGPER